MNIDEDLLRLEILQKALLLESLISHNLGLLLKFDVENSLTLGNKSSSLSLKAKTDLLIDIGALDKGRQKRIIYFMEIRNQFLHNLKCKSFDDFYKYNESTSNALIKLYEPKEDTLDDKLKSCFVKLSGDVIQIALEVFDDVQNRRIEDRGKEIYKHGFDAITESAIYSFQQLRDDSKTLSEIGITSDQFDKIQKLFTHQFDKKFDELMDKDFG